MPTTEEVVVDHIIEAGDAVLGKAELDKISNMGLAARDGPIEKKAQAPGFQALLPPASGVVRGRALSHQHRSRAVQSGPQRGGDARQCVVTRNKNDFRIKLREPAPKK